MCQLVGSTIQLFNFSGTNLLNTSGSATLHSGDTVGYTAHATVTTGTLDFSPSWDIGADIEPDLSDPGHGSPPDATQTERSAGAP